MEYESHAPNRRTFLKTALVGSAASMCAGTGLAADDVSAVPLSAKHKNAVNRQRRIVVQYDAYNSLGGDFEQWLKYRFAYADEPNSQIDAIWWDIGPMGPGLYPGRQENPVLQQWRELGIDWVGRLVEETRKRGLEVCWNHRVSEVDISQTGRGAAWKELPHPLKQQHPDWLLKTWWPHGLWNYAVPKVRQFKVDLLRQLAEMYDFDGFQLDFARHVPCLPVGRQWELRGHVTKFVRMVRLMLQDVARRRGKPIFLAARVPQSLSGCKVDGFDICEWARQQLIDIFTIGTRSFDVDLAGYRQATTGTGIKLQPCLDDHHATDGYRYPPIEVFRGVFANWWQQGADSVVTFNWSNAPPKVCEQIGAPAGPPMHLQAYREVGTPEMLVNKNKTFVVERRGGYPWAEGFFNRNDTAPLPIALNSAATPVSLTIRVSDDLPKLVEQLKQVTLRIILFNATKDDVVKAQVNANHVPLQNRDATWKDSQICSPRPQRPSGGNGNYPVNPAQKLACLDFAVDPRLCCLGENQVSVFWTGNASSHHVIVEKLELHVEYL